MNTVFNAYDYIFLLIIGVSAVFGLFRGAIGELLSLLLWVSAYFLFKHYYGYLDKFVPAIISYYWLRTVVVYIVGFVFLAIVIKIIKMIVMRFVSALNLTGINYLFGLLFGVGRGVLICVLLLLLVDALNLESLSSWHNAKLAPFMLNVLKYIRHI